MPATGGRGGTVDKALGFLAEGPGFESQSRRQGLLSWNQLCTDSKRCVLGKDTLPPFSTLSDESINRGLVCVARIPSSTDFKDPDAHVLDG